MLVESGGDNLTATFSRGLVDRQIFVVDVAGGDKVPRKGGPGVTSADLLVINKTDLAPLVARRTGPDTVHLVSAAANPLGGDSIHIRVVVEAGRLRGAHRGSHGDASRFDHRGVPCALDARGAGDLDVDPQPDRRRCNVATLHLDAGGADRWRPRRLRERIQIGRSNERQGFWSGSLHADVDGSPLLRHRIELGNASVADDALGTPLACISELRYPDSGFRPRGTSGAGRWRPGYLAGRPAA